MGLGNPLASQCISPAGRLWSLAWVREVEMGCGEEKYLNSACIFKEKPL